MTGEPYPYKPVQIEPRPTPFSDMVVSLLQSKKFVASVTASLAIVVIRLAGKAGWIVDVDTAREIANAVLGLAAAYVVGQGFADNSKEAAQISADAQVEVAEIAASAKVKAEEVNK